MLIKHCPFHIGSPASASAYMCDSNGDHDISMTHRQGTPNARDKTRHLKIRALVRPSGRLGAKAPRAPAIGDEDFRYNVASGGLKVMLDQSDTSTRRISQAEHLDNFILVPSRAR